MLAEKFVWVLPRSNTFLFKKSEVYESIISTYPKVLSLDVDMHGFKTLDITITERQPNALWCSGVPPHVTKDSVGRCFFVDNLGYIYTPSPYFSDHVYFELFGEPSDYKKIHEIFSATSTDTNISDTLGTGPETKELSFVGTHFLPEEKYVTVINFIELLNMSGIETHTLIVHSNELFELVMKEGGVLRFNLETDLERMVGDLKTALDTKLNQSNGKTLSDVEYIDIRFANKVVFKFIE